MEKQKFVIISTAVSLLSLALAIFFYFTYRNKLSLVSTSLGDLIEKENVEHSLEGDVDTSGIYFLTDDGSGTVKANIVAQRGISSAFNKEKNAFILQIEAPTCTQKQKLLWTGKKFECAIDIDTASSTTNNPVDNDSTEEDIDTDTNNYVTGITFNSGTGELAISRNGLEGLSVDLDGRYLSSFVEGDSVVGNEVTGETTGKGLARSGSGTELNPYTLGVDFSSNCSGASSKLLYNGATGTWSCGSDIDTDTDTTYTASESGLTLSGTTFGLELDGATLSMGSSGLKVASITTSEITDGTITNGDISNSAAIDWSKVSKSGAVLTDFGVPTYTGNAGKVLSVNGTEDGLVWATVTGGVTADSLDFTELKDGLTLDASTTITFGSYDTIFNMNGTGDFRVQDNGTDVLYISDSGNIGVQTTSPSGKLHVVGNMYISGDKHIECDGSTSNEVGNCSAHSEASTIVALAASDRICSNSATSPTAIRIDTDSDCTNGSGNEGTYILGTSATAATTSITSQWAYFDANSSTTYTNGEDIYLDNAPTLTYQSGNLYVDHVTLLEPAWEDLRLSASQLGSGASAPDLVTWINASNLRVKAFDGTTTSEQLYFEVQFPHNYKEGTDLHAHIHWGPTTADAGDVKWNLEYSWVNIGDVAPAVQTVAATGAAGGTAFRHNMVDLPVISGSGKTLSSMIVGRLYRNPSDGSDTYGFDAALLELDFHYQIDGFGSVSKTSKD